MNENPEYRDELKDAPNLRKIGNKNPFKVPEGYFERLKHEGFAFESLEEAEETILPDIDKTNVFKTPENYFEGVLPKFEQIIDTEDVENSKRLISKGKLLSFSYFISIAAAVLLLFLVFFEPQSPGSESIQSEFAELNDFSLDQLIAEVEPERLSEDMILGSFEEQGWEEWIEDENGVDFEFLEENEANIDNLIEGIDVYDLEDELGNLN